jgi:hypothetical protein
MVSLLNGALCHEREWQSGDTAPRISKPLVGGSER